MKNLRYHRVLSTIRSAVYLAVLIALVWFLISTPGIRETIGGLGISLLWILVLASAVIVIAQWLQQRRAPIIYPFINATGDKENQAQYDALALNFSELLQLEIQRITHLLYIPESIAVHNPAFDKQQVPRPIVTPAGPAALGSARVESELGEMLKGIGALSLGPVNLPLGGLLYLLMQALQGGGITGKLQKVGGKLSVVASYANRKYEAGSDTLSIATQSDEEITRGLVRQIAYMMSSDFADFPPSRWQSFQEVVDGLEDYRRYLLSGKRNHSALDAAHKHFEQAIVADSQYALAYYNLGMLYEEHGNLSSAFEMYKQAVQAEPNLREAQFQLGKAYFQRGQSLSAVQAGRRAVNLAQKSRKPFPIARTFLGKWLYSLAYESRGNLADALKYCNESLEQFKIAKKEFIQLIQQERRRLDSSEQRLVSLKVSAINSLTEFGQAYQVLANLLENAQQKKITFRRKIISARKKAESALKQCLKLHPESSVAHASLAFFYMEQKNYSLAKKYLELVGGISPEDESVVLELGATYLSPAIDALMGLYEEFRENQDGWNTNWPEPRVNATQSQLDLAAFHYRTVIDLIRYRGEAGLEEQDSMIRALNGLASVYGSQAIIQCVRNEDCTSLITDAKRCLGKALVLNPFAAEVYDNLAGLYAIQLAVQSPRSETIPADKDQVDSPHSLDVTVLPPMTVAPTENELIQQAYITLTEYVRNYGLTDPYTLAMIALALAFSTPEQRDSQELMTRFLEERILNLPSLEEIEASPVSQIYLWVAGWMGKTIGMPELGIQYLERAKKMGHFPEAELVDYDLGNVYLSLKEWFSAIECFQKMEQTDPYYWQGRMTLADALREIETLSRDGAGGTDSSQNVLPKVIRNSDEHSVESETQTGVQSPAAEGRSGVEIEEGLSDSGENSIVPLSLQEIPTTELPDQQRYSLPEDEWSAERVYGDAILAAGDDPYRRATALASRADLLLSRRKYVEAIKDCQEALSLVPAYAYPHRILALIYIDMYDYDRAIKEWQHVGQLVQDMDEPQYHLGLGAAYISSADSSSDPAVAESRRWQAVREYQHALELFIPNEMVEKARVQTVLGDILLILKKFREAEIAYLSALELSKGMPNEHLLHAKLAFLYIKRGLHLEAYSEYKKAITLCEEQLQEAQKNQDTQTAGELAGSLAYACNMLAYYLHAERGVNLEEGLTLVNRALTELECSNLDEMAKRDNRGAYLDTRGWLCYRQRNYLAAKQDLEEALALTMGTVYEHGHLALVYERLAEASENDSERKHLQVMSKEQWQLAFDSDQEGIWSAFKSVVSNEAPKQ